MPICKFIFIHHFPSTGFDSYLQSKKESKVCKSIFVENNDYLKVGTKIDFIENSKLVLFMIISIYWILFTLVGCLLKVTNNRKEANLKILKWIPLGFSASIFIALTILMSIDKFYPTNFCLMNSQDGICSPDELNCFTKENAGEFIFLSDFGFGKILLINSTMKSDLGKRHKIFR